MWWTDRRAHAGAAVAIAALALGACASTRTPEPVAFDTPLDQFPLKAELAPDELALAPHREGLSANQRAHLAAFVGRWRATDRREVIVRTPEPSADADAVSRIAADVVGTLQALGVPRERVRIGPAAPGAPDAPVVVSFLRYQAHVADCASTWDDLTSTGSNRPTTSFGCTVTANLAAMIADPADLAAPHPMDPGDAARRAVVLGRYRQGQVTSSARDDQAVGTISNAVR